MVLALLHQHLHPLERHEDCLGGARHHRSAKLARRLPQTEPVAEGPAVLRVTAEHDGAAGEPHAEGRQESAVEVPNAASGVFVVELRRGLRGRDAVHLEGEVNAYGDFQRIYSVQCFQMCKRKDSHSAVFQCQFAPFLLPEHGLVDGEGARDGHDGRPAAGRVLPPAALVATVAADDVMLGHGGGDGRRRRRDLVATELKVIYARTELILFSVQRKLEVCDCLT